MLIQDCDSSKELNSDLFWKGSIISHNIKLKSNLAYKKYSQDSSKILNLNYDKSQFTIFNEKIKTSQKTIKNIR